MLRRTFLNTALTALPLFGGQSGGDNATLSVRVLDKATGAAMPATVRLRSGGEAVIENPGFSEGFHTAGEFRKELSPGKALLRVSRGFDFEEWQEELTLEPGEHREIVIELARRTPLHDEGWRCGDNHVHMTHGESRIIVDFDYLALAARAVGLDYMSVAQRWNLPDPSPLAIEAECRRVSQPDCHLTWNMEAPKNYFQGNVSHCLGHGWFVGVRGYDAQRRNVIEQITAMSAGDYQSAKTSTPNFETHALIHAQGGAVAYTHPCRWWWGKWGGRGIYPLEERKFVSNMAQELPFDTVAGPTYDAVDILMQTREKEVNAQGQQLWFMLLNHGYRMPGTASSDATFDNPGRAVPGNVRVYTNTGDAFSMEGLVTSLRSGRNFVTSGPLIALDVSGHGPGGVIRVSGSQRMRARIRAWAAPTKECSLAEVELVQNGEVLKKFSLPGQQSSFETTFEWNVEQDGWVIARCFGADRDNEVAITNPVYWETRDSRRPQPTAANIALGIVDDRTGATLGGKCSVIERVGLEDRLLQTHEFRDGALRFTAPATARIRLDVPGYVSLSQSIFLDTPELLSPTLNMRVEQLLSWTTFERFASALENVRLNFRMQQLG